MLCKTYILCRAKQTDLWFILRLKAQKTKTITFKLRNDDEKSIHLLAWLLNRNMRNIYGTWCFLGGPILFRV